MSGEALSGVSRTAVWAAGLRASESERADRWFDDQFAAVFASVAGSGATLDVKALPPGTHEVMAIRTRFYDDQARAACAAGIRQVVLLAAGLDSRAFRLDWPDNVRLFELDLPGLFAFKEAALASVNAVARCVRIVVAVDLRDQWAGTLIAAGFDPAVATAWLAEGLLPYLEPASSDKLLATATELSAAGSQLAFDYAEAAALDQMAHLTSEDMRQVSALLKAAKGSPTDWLATHGWQHSSQPLPALGERYGRPLPAGADLVMLNAAILVAASR